MEYFQFTFLFSFVTGILSPFSLKSYISGFPNKSVCEIWKVIIMSSSTLPSYSSSSFRLWYKTFTTQHTLVTLSITHQTRAKVVQKETFLKVKWQILQEQWETFVELVLTGLASAKSLNVPFLPISFLYTTMGKWTSRMQLLYMARPRTMPISVYCPSFSNDDGLNQNSFVRSSYVNIPGEKKKEKKNQSVNSWNILAF